MWSIAGILRSTDVLCCWMYHANFLGWLLTRLVPVKRLVWNIRHASLDPEVNSRLTLQLSRICARVSSAADVIIYNGTQSRQVHEAAGYARNRGTILGNGCDSSIFRPDSSSYDDVCHELGLQPGAKIILSVGRNHPIKDIPTFIAAFAAVHRTMPDSVAVMCGRDITPSSPDICGICEQHNLTVGHDIFLLGQRDDLPRLMAATMVYVLHSRSEAFPNALMQAMACGCMCVSTEVGAAGEILHDAECLVSPGSSADLADRVQRLLTLPEAAQKQVRLANRERIRKHYDIREIVKDYELLYKQ